MSLKDKINEIEKEEIIRALKECNWVMAKAARKLGITERMIGYKVKKYKIRKGGIRDRGISTRKPVTKNYTSGGIRPRDYFKGGQDENF